MDKEEKKQTGYIAVWVILLSLVMEAVFLLLRKWDLSVLFGNLGGAAAAIGNFFLMALINTRIMHRALQRGKPEEAAAQVKAVTMGRLVGCVLFCVLLIAVCGTNVYATLIPMLFPQVGVMFWSASNRKRSAEQPGEEGSDLID